jgi:GT2 family glycosyltransferase
MMMKRKTAIIILGPHRSGTSAIAGAISRLTKASFGRLLMQAQHDNHQGFFENEKIVNLNDFILAEVYRTWDDPRAFDQSLLESVRLDDLRKRAKEVLNEEYDRSNLIAIKDPRLCLTFPFWEPILTHAGYDIQVILTYRRVEEIVKSLSSREWLSQEYAFILTTMYTLYAEKSTREYNRVWVDYNRALSEKDYLLRRLSLQLVNIDLQINVNNGLNPKLQHSDANESNEKWTQSDYKSISEALKEIEAISSQEGMNPNINLLDQALLSYNDLISEIGLHLLRSKVDHAKVIFRYNGQQDHIIHSCKLDEDKMSFEVSWSATNRPNEILVIPIHRSANIKYLDIQLNGESTYQITHNTSWQKADILGFEDSQPRIIVRLTGRQVSNTCSCSISYSYEDYKPHTLPKTSVLYIALAAFFTLLSSPFKVIRSINKENWRTLRSAVRRESSKQILRNFIRLINRASHKGDVETEVIRISKVQQKRYRKKLVYVGPTVPRFDKSSGERRADQILKIIASSSQLYCIISKTPQQIYVDRMADYGVQIIMNNDKNGLNELGKVDVVIYDKYYTYYDEFKLKKYFKNARHIIDTVDVHWVREMRGADSNPDYNKARVAKNKVREIDAYKEVDEIWVVSQPDADALKEEGVLPERIKIVSNIHSIQVQEFKIRQEPILFFLGNYKHEPNVWTAQWLASEVFPIIRKSVPNAQLWLAGAEIMPSIADLELIDGVSIIGYIPEEELAGYYSKTTLVLAPLLAGAGVKGKLLEAISNMTPLLTNDIGNEGLNIGHGRDGFVVNELSQIAKTAVDVLNNEYNLSEITKNAQANVLSRFTYASAKMSIESSLYPFVDICIVTHNRLELLRTCLSSILQHTLYPNYTIKVYSNACSDGSKSYLEDIEKKYHHISVVYSKTNEVFVGPNNLMMESSSEDVLLLNNDTEVTPGWLMGLHTISYREEDIGIVGPALTYVDGTVQEIGSEIYPDGTGVNYCNKYSWGEIATKTPHTVPYVSGCAMFIKRAMLNSIGSFDPIYHPCYFEDSDLCYRAWQNNWKVVVVPEVIVTHHGGATAGVSLDSGYKSHQVKNAKAFLDSHKSQLTEVKSKCKSLNKTIALL